MTAVAYELVDADGQVGGEERLAVGVDGFEDRGGKGGKIITATVHDALDDLQRDRIVPTEKYSARGRDKALQRRLSGQITGDLAFEVG